MKKLFTFFLFIVISTFTLAQPNTPNPADAAVGVGVIHDFSWTWGSTADRIQFSTSSNMASPTVHTIAANAFTNTTPLLNGVTYYWQVSADAGATWLPVVPFSFTTVPPAVPYLSSPANLTIVSNELLTFSWSTGVEGLVYDLEVSTNPGMTALVGAASTTTPNTYVTLNTSIFTQGTPYWWRVTSRTLGGAVINYSNVWRFDMAGLPTPVASYPTGGVNIYNNPPSLYWYLLAYNAAITGYDVKYSVTSPAACQAVTSPNVVDATDGYFSTESTNWFTTIPFALTPGATYYWQVAPKAGATVGTFSSVNSFVVYGTYTFLVCYPIYPVLGASVQAEPTFYWTTNTYAPVLFFQLEIDDDPLFGSINLTVSDIAAASYTLTSGNVTTLNPTLGGTYY
jgi:hypothetical protein